MLKRRRLGLGCFECAFVRCVGTLAELFNLAPPSAVDGNGPRGLADRPWLRQPAETP
jgi:hypothetical protein